jgi:hypothetical protein
VKTNGGEASVSTNRGNYRVSTRGGAIKLNPGLGAIQLEGIEDQIQLGIDPVSHATKFEELELALQSVVQQVNQMYGLIASHVHPIPTPAVGVVGPAPSLAPLATAIPFNISGAKSESTKLR